MLSNNDQQMRTKRFKHDMEKLEDVRKRKNVRKLRQTTECSMNIPTGQSHKKKLKVSRVLPLRFVGSFFSSVSIIADNPLSYWYSCIVSGRNTAFCVFFVIVGLVVFELHVYGNASGAKINIQEIWNYVYRFRMFKR